MGLTLTIFRAITNVTAFIGEEDPALGIATVLDGLELARRMGIVYGVIVNHYDPFEGRYGTARTVSARAPEREEGSTVLAHIARTSYRHRRRVLLAWIAFVGMTGMLRARDEMPASPPTEPARSRSSPATGTLIAPGSPTLTQSQPTMSSSPRSCR